mgnify:CR=1 FL=1
MAGDHDHGQRAVGPHQLFQELHAAHAGHLDVGDHDTGVIRPQRFQRVLGAAERLCVIARKRQPLADRLTHVLFIINDRDFHCLSHWFTLPPVSSLCCP